MKDPLKIRAALEAASRRGRISAFIVLTPEAREPGRIVIRWPTDGAGRLHAYAYFPGLGWRHGSATGYGYDKRTAAVAEALPEHVTDSGYGWEHQLHTQGMTVHQAI